MTALVELSGVTRSFAPRSARRSGAAGASIDVLTGVDLTIDEGDYTAVLGRSGAGKSTLLAVIGLLDRPSSGRHVFDGVDLATAPDRIRVARRAEHIGFVFQAFHLVSGLSVLENVALAGLYSGRPRAQRLAAAEEALETVGLTHRRDASPSTLSGGERQRTAVARAVASSPRLLLADEPTGNLDRTNADGVMDLFAELNAAGQTIVVITHDEVVATRAHRRVRLQDGRIVETANAPAPPESSPSAASVLGRSSV
jgi:putative ABC transport system ATP-binding protein